MKRRDDASCSPHLTSPHLIPSHTYIVNAISDEGRINDVRSSFLFLGLQTTRDFYLYNTILVKKTD